MTELSDRAHYALANIFHHPPYDPFDVAVLTRADWMRIPNVGKATASEIASWVKHCGVSEEWITQRAQMIDAALRTLDGSQICSYCADRTRLKLTINKMLHAALVKKDEIDIAQEAA